MTTLSRAEANRVAAKLSAWDVAYHDGKPVVSDAKWDRYRDLLARGAPAHPYLKKIGAPIKRTARGERVSSRKEKLPFPVGSLDKKRPAELPRWMEQIASKMPQTSWLTKPKFDGASGTILYVDGRMTRAWTRGDGVEGQVVTEAMSYVQGAQHRLVDNKAFDPKGKYCVRGEVVMHRSIFDKYYAVAREGSESELGKTYKTSRNMVTGLLNRIDAHEVSRDLKRCTFIALQLFKFDEKKKIWVRPDDAHREYVYLTCAGFTTWANPQRYAPGHKKILELVRQGHGGLRKVLPVLPYEGNLGSLSTFASIPTEEEVTARLEAIRKAVDVPVDGIVVEPLHNKYWQKRGLHLEARPPFMIAVKPDAHDQQSYVGSVGEIEWNVSKRGLLKPRLILAKALNFDGVEVNHATCNNASFVKKWGLRPGRKLKLVRSGDVIPRIVAVLDGTKLEQMYDKKGVVLKGKKQVPNWVPLHTRKKVTIRGEKRTKLVEGRGIEDARVLKSIPTKCPACGTKTRWSSKGTDLECVNVSCEGRRDKSVVSFFRHLGVDDVASGIVGHMIESGLDTVPKILRGATVQKLRRLEGYGDKKAASVAAAIAGALKGKTLASVMHASGVFSSSEFALGSTRLAAIVDCVGAGPVNRASPAALRRKLADLSGLGKRGLDLFIDRLPAWRKFYAGIADMHEESRGPKTLKGCRVAFTGFRDQSMADYVTQRGGSVGGVSKTCTVLFAASLGSGKANRADALGVPVVPQARAWDWLKSRGD